MTINSINHNQDPLTQALSDLDWEMEPQRDLWPQIESAIRLTRKPAKTQSYWPSFAIAASILLGVSALMFSFMTHQRADQLQIAQLRMAEFQRSHIALIEQQHQLVRTQLSLALVQGSEHINPQLAKEIRKVQVEIDEASLEIKNAIELQPFNSNYASMLARTYQRETRLLNRLAPPSNTSI